MLVSLLAYSGPRPESEALPLRWWQIGERTINYRATKGGRVKPRHTKLLAPLSRPATPSLHLPSSMSGPRSEPQSSLTEASDGGRTTLLNRSPRT
jgi:hypothetical protein